MWRETLLLNNFDNPSIPKLYDFGMLHNKISKLPEHTFVIIYFQFIGKLRSRAGSPSRISLTYISQNSPRSSKWSTSLTTTTTSFLTMLRTRPSYKTSSSKKTRSQWSLNSLSTKWSRMTMIAIPLWLKRTLLTTTTSLKSRRCFLRSKL